MRRSRKVGLGLAGVVAAMALALGLANAQTASVTVPRGPYVDFCPSPEQVAVHAEKYGFDYKPTVSCTADGEVESAEAERQAPPVAVPDAVARAREKAELSRLRRGPERDGDPATIEGVTPEGDEVVIIIQTSEPERFRGMTPAEFAERAYP